MDGECGDVGKQAKSRLAILGRKLGATRLLAVAAAYTALVVAAIVIVGGSTGLRR